MTVHVVTALHAASLGHTGNLVGLNLGYFMTKHRCSKAHGGRDMAMAAFAKLRLIPGDGLGKPLEDSVPAGGGLSGAQHPAAVVGCLGEPHHGSQLITPLKPDVQRDDCHEPRT